MIFKQNKTTLLDFFVDDQTCKVDVNIVVLFLYLVHHILSNRMVV